MKLTVSNHNHKEMTIPMQRDENLENVTFSRFSSRLFCDAGTSEEAARCSSPANPRRHEENSHVRGVRIPPSRQKTPPVEWRNDARRSRPRCSSPTRSAASTKSNPPRRVTRARTRAARAASLSGRLAARFARSARVVELRDDGVRLVPAIHDAERRLIDDAIIEPR